MTTHNMKLHSVHSPREREELRNPSPAIRCGHNGIVGKKPQSSLLLAVWHKRITWKLAKIVGYLWCCIDTRHREIVLRNLEFAFGDELSEREREGICRGTFVHIACVLLELPYLLFLSRENVERIMTFSGLENLYAVVKKGKGILGMTSHFGNWELMALGFSLCYWPVNVVVRPLDNIFLDRLIDRIRSRGGNRTISKSGSARNIIRLLRQGKAVAFLIDQNVDWYEGVFVPFFKEIACTSKALATLALRTRLPVLPFYNFRRADGSYEVVFEPEVQLIRSGDSAADIKENTALFNRIIESYVRAHPEQWFWLHQRWKTRPGS
jgi:KDO2-lipid IV(A) lauroyltransferase